MCRELGHRAQSCPLSGRCHYYHQDGHMASDCARAWDPLFSVPVDIDVPVDPDVDVSSASLADTVPVSDKQPISPTADTAPV